LLRYLKNIFSIPCILFKVQRQLKVQRRFLREELMPLVYRFYDANDGTLSSKDVDKIRKYYGLAVPAILGEAFAALRQRPLSVSERRTATYLGATTGLYDDFFEMTNLSDDYIKNMCLHPEIHPGQHDNERLANICWRETLQGCPNPELLKALSEQVHDAQIRSRLQKKGELDQSQILHITRDKGGYSVLIYMAMFYHSIPPQDHELFYNAGALLQLENDLFDVYKDSRDEIATLVTKCASIARLREIYSDLWQQFKSSIHATGFPQKGKNQFLKLMGALVGRGFVCLDMLAEREKQNKGHFQPEAFTRKELICDMEKPANILKSMYYYARLV
jgi:hypothetical protein